MNMETQETLKEVGKSAFEKIILQAIKDMAKGRKVPHCGEQQGSLDEIDWAEAYAEPGYDTPKNGILLANWNRFPTDIDQKLERAGYAVEWFDEWCRCDDCSRIVRQSPDSYGWRQSYKFIHDCEIFCKDCLLKDLDAYEDMLLNRVETADTFDVDWEKRGFTRFNSDHYESGFHRGQDDKPKEIIKKIPKGYDFLFAIPLVGQFDISFDCWIRPKPEN